MVTEVTLFCISWSPTPAIFLLFDTLFLPYVDILMREEVHVNIGFEK